MRKKTNSYNRKNALVPNNTKKQTNLNNIKKISLSRKKIIDQKIKENFKNLNPDLAISFMIHTASMDHFLKVKGIDSYFEALVSCLSKQTFKKFELIYIDTFYELNKKHFFEIIKSLPFQVKHVEIHPEHRYWYDMGHTYISAAKNTGILYADGELCVTCDDAEFFPEHLLGLYWDEYLKGRLMLALHKRLKSVKTNQGKITLPISGEEYINDSRFEHLQDKCYRFHNMGGLAFAGTSFPLKDAVFLNGFNEKMDGCKSLEDCEFGGRLSLLGRKFSLLKSGYLYILDHPSYSVTVIDSNVSQNKHIKPEEIQELNKKKISNFVAIENYSMVQCSQRLLDIKANTWNLTEKHLEIIKQETLKYRGFDPTSEEHIDKFKVWLGCPNFNLELQRKELRNSEKWIWKKY